MEKVKAHTHEYISDTGTMRTGYTCRICGFRIPLNLARAAHAAGAIFVDDKKEDS
jgi:hypothetical protein